MAFNKTRVSMNQGLSACKRVDLAVQPELIPVAQYVRMSDEAQQYSIENQKAAIEEYAARHGFEIVKTYADPGKSGVVATHRKGLAELLSDVVGGKPPYKAILVYDISRWGRFQNNDEAAHYEFLCCSSGIPLHYCAEPFANDGTATSALLKALKRSMAAEFSRELSEKEVQGKSRIVRLGFWTGGKAGYGYRRLLVSPDGQPKQIMASGEHKNIRTDRVILVPGPRDEVESVRRMFTLAARGKSCGAIARELNASMQNSKPWTRGRVYTILHNPKYMGWNVWHRTTKRLQGTWKQLGTQEWVIKEDCFLPIVDENTFREAQAALRRSGDKVWSEDEMLRRVRRLLRKKGRLSAVILKQARGTPSFQTIRRRFGTCQQLYKLVPYRPPKRFELANKRSIQSLRLRQQLIAQISAMFPENVVSISIPDTNRKVLLVDNQIRISVLCCPFQRRHGKRKKNFRWIVKPYLAERGYITLACLMNQTCDGVIGQFIFPRLNGFKWHEVANLSDPLLLQGLRLDNLSGFYEAVKKLWVEQH